ncbi:MAG TPA: CocE/NonD family hydrolase [Candidatus Sulfotelmatobacter sp.]|nr:CocE/NonD family hydrolase [Candidatus Sulfotelmatobacter sp.]
MRAYRAFVIEFLLAVPLGVTILLGTSVSSPAQAQPSGLPSEMPAKLQPVTSSFDYVRRDVMIPMRDGVRLHTAIVVPKGAKNAPMLLTRTPYNASAQVRHFASAHLGPILNGYDNAVETILEGGYIRVVQDVRGKYGSEGDYVMTRPLHGPLNPTPVDHSTDTYDTIDWLVKNVPESNGKVGILGISYDGFTTLMGMVNPHPALKVAVPMNPMVDGWMGDDWFHNGAFRAQNLPYIYEQEGTRSNDEDKKWWVSHFDDYDEYMAAGSSGELGRQHGEEQVGFWRKLLEHPDYDSWWQQQAMDKILAKEPLKLATMLVDSLWDQEDIYGAPAVYKALKANPANDDKLFLVLGPWHHGQEIEDGSSLGAIKFDSDTGLYFRREILLPFLNHYLQDDTPEMNVAKVEAFETGTNRWLQLPSWPAGCKSACPIRSKPLYLHDSSKLSFAEPRAGEAEYDEYVSDPAKPVPFRTRPVQPVGYGDGFTWSEWLVDDQREPSGRTDVVSFVTDALTEPVKIAGQPVVNLTASTSGTDSDWVVKVIDVYPEEAAPQTKMGGYELMISGDIFRGRYRESYEHPKPIEAGKPLLYKWTLPTANHVFLPGHRIMVQIQSSWFPLYDRNPQTFVQNIFWAKPGDYKKATQRIYHAPGEASFVELPVVGR